MRKLIEKRAQDELCSPYFKWAAGGGWSNKGKLGGFGEVAEPRDETLQQGLSPTRL